MNIIELNMSSRSETYLRKTREFNFRVLFSKSDALSLKLIKITYI
jgi:hypothetical protein